MAYLPGRRKTAPERTFLSAARDDSVREWRIGATQEHLLAWIAVNRYAPGLTCQQRAQYHVGRCVRGAGAALPGAS